MDQQQMIQLSLAFISLVSVIGSGLLSYKTHTDKNAQKSEENRLKSEEEFRSDLLSMIYELSERIKILEDANEKLCLELDKAEIKIKELEAIVEEQFDTIAALSSFCKYIPAPVWLKRVMEDGNTTMYFINRQYEDKYGISADYYIGRTDDEVWGKEISDHFRKADTYILKYKKGATFIENIPVDPFDISKGHHKCIVWKFPILNNQLLIGIGGILVDIDEYILMKTQQ